MSDRGAGRGEDGGARARILGRIAEALAGRARTEHPGPGPAAARSGGFGQPTEGPEQAAGSAVVEAFVAAFRRAGGESVRLPDLESARAWLRDFGADFGSAAVGADVPDDLAPELPVGDPADAALGVSVAAAAAADTGTLVLPSTGGRAVQLLPPVHLVWVLASAVRGTLAEALEEARDAGLPAVLALHSGPSKSADIGRITVTGVHGPGRVVAVVVGGEAGIETERSGSA